ncbi:phosphoribosylformylglycinamidine synthase subunit PurL [Cerasicoccus maritimus]|uniref:phosphoribosylformylglycinamidine synthase subunit PurL n=1 Tax=Cerasicoccus maritimus TaxID=490089 RepID=UPI0028529C35|nr:phosphoribosylformylglycinamidine synthase subunit PurL [Cerasicoccus maritimus]
MATEAPAPNPDPTLNVPITPELVEKHGLSTDDYELIKKILGREPNLTELGIFSVMWSEHCSYRNSRKLLKQFPTQKFDEDSRNKVLVKAGEENAGVIDVGDDFAICFKIESHNHPSAVEPFEGAATGVGGILRDIFTMGARPVLFTNSLRFGKLDSADSRRIMRGVVHGISHYGNCVGIPNIGGDVYFDDCYEGNPLVNALCLGVLKHDQIKRGAASGVGNPVYYVGAATGRDGLGGASFASKELSEESVADRPAVQKGDPFMGKLLMEACLEMMAVDGLVVGIQDMGAAGLTCSTCETAARGNTGVEIELDLVPQRETGMNSYEIMLSESQERMLVIVQAGREEEVEKIFEKWDLHAAKVGAVIDGTDMVVKQHGQVVARIPAYDLTEEAPLNDPEAKRPAYLDEIQTWTPEQIDDLTETGIAEALPKLLSDPTIANKSWIYRQYDQMVMTSTVEHAGESDAGVIRLRCGGPDKDKYIAISNDCNNRYCWADPYEGGKIAVAEAIRNLACAGARPLAMTNNLNFGNPNKPESFYMLKEAVRGLAETCEFFDVPVVGGNVSLYNENQESKIDPTPVVSVVGIIDSRQYITPSLIKKGNEAFILLGDVADELGCSAYLRVIKDLKTGKPPAMNLEKQASLMDFLQIQIQKGRIHAAHDVSEGGMLVALCEMLFTKSKTFGADLNLEDLPIDRWDTLFFGESQGRILLAVDANKADHVVHDAERYDIHADILGEANDEGILHIEAPNLENPIQWDSNELRKAWDDAIPQAMKI